MTEQTVPESLDDLELFVGQWRMVAGFASNEADAPRAVTTFNWLSGRRFLIQQWEVDHPDAPDGIAIIGVASGDAPYVQHYFDSRGVSRTYDMEFADRTWALHRVGTSPDFSQRFFGNFSEDTNTIVGRWEICRGGSSWSHDFDLTYVRVVDEQQHGG